MAKKLESTFINMVAVLFIVTALAALALGSVYTATKGPIEVAKAAKLKRLSLMWCLHTIPIIQLR